MGCPNRAMLHRLIEPNTYVSNQICARICARDAVGQVETRETRRDPPRIPTPVRRGQRGDQRRPETPETCVVWLITQRSRVQIPPPLPGKTAPEASLPGPFSATCDQAPGHIRVRSLGASPEMPQVPTVFSLVPLRSARSGPCPSSRTMMRRRPCRCGCVSVPSALHPSAWAIACCPLAWPTRIRAAGAHGFSVWLAAGS